MNSYKIAIAGAGFSGGIVAAELIKHTKCEIILLDKCGYAWESESWTALNINPNWIRSLESLDSDLCWRLMSAWFLRKTIRAEKINGDPLYNLPMYEEWWQGIALNPGLRISWKQAYSVIREKLSIWYNQEIIGCDFNASKNKWPISIKIMDRTKDEIYSILNVDFLIATEGRYSWIRQQISSFNAQYIGVSNFRLIVPDTSGGMFDDFELFYTDNPLGRKYHSWDSNFDFSLSSIPRLWVMKVPSSSWGWDLLWIFGNFWIKNEISNFSKTPQWLTELYSPWDSIMSDKWKYLLKTITDNAHSMHWSRMQHWPICFGSPEKNILFLGDSAHCICPTMWQGATLAIEDACVASKILVEDILFGQLGKGTIMKISKLRSSRRDFVSRVSLMDSCHLMSHKGWDNVGRLLQKTKEMKDESSVFMGLLRKVWTDGPCVNL